MILPEMPGEGLGRLRPALGLHALLVDQLRTNSSIDTPVCRASRRGQDLSPGSISRMVMLVPMPAPPCRSTTVPLTPSSPAQRLTTNSEITTRGGREPSRMLAERAYGCLLAHGLRQWGTAVYLSGLVRPYGVLAASDLLSLSAIVH